MMYLDTDSAVFSCLFYYAWLKRSKTWYFVAKFVLTYCEKKLFQWSRKSFEIRGWMSRICKIFVITRTICSNSERSEKLTSSWRSLRFDKLEQLEFNFLRWKGGEMQLWNDFDLSSSQIWHFKCARQDFLLIFLYSLYIKRVRFKVK